MASTVSIAPIITYLLALPLSNTDVDVIDASDAPEIQRLSRAASSTTITEAQRCYLLAAYLKATLLKTDMDKGSWVEDLKRCARDLEGNPVAVPQLGQAFHKWQPNIRAVLQSAEEIDSKLNR